MCPFAFFALLTSHTGWTPFIARNGLVPIAKTFSIPFPIMGVYYAWPYYLRILSGLLHQASLCDRTAERKHPPLENEISVNWETPKPQRGKQSDAASAREDQDLEVPATRCLRKHCLLVFPEEDQGQGTHRIVDYSSTLADGLDHRLTNNRIQDKLTILPYPETPFISTAVPLKGAAYYEGELGISRIYCTANNDI